MDIKFIIGSFCVEVVLCCLVIMIFSSERFKARMMQRKLFEISQAIRNSKNSKYLTFNCHEKMFKISIEKADGPDGIYFSTSEYSYINVYINDELVCRLHGIESCITFRKIYFLEFNSNRHQDEINSLIKSAYKVAAKAENDRFRRKQKADYRSKSLFINN